jgi:hypothetical protein
MFVIIRKVHITYICMITLNEKTRGQKIRNKQNYNKTRDLCNKKTTPQDFKNFRNICMFCVSYACKAGPLHERRNLCL